MTTSNNDTDTNDSDPLAGVTTWDKDGNPYWNGVAKSAGHPPGTGKVHKARIENGRVVEVQCHARVETWIPLGNQNVGESRRTCNNCNQVHEVPGAEYTPISRVELTQDYNPERYLSTDVEGSE